MEKKNKLEVIGFVLMAIGGLFWLSEKFYVVQSLNTVYSLTRILLYFGLAIWALGLMKKEAQKRKQKESDKMD